MGCENPYRKKNIYPEQTLAVIFDAIKNNSGELKLDLAQGRISQNIGKLRKIKHCWNLSVNSIRGECQEGEQDGN